MEATTSSSLFESARAVAQNLGLGELGGAKLGGGSDGNFTAGIGIPGLDGLGAVGGGAHTDNEHSVVAEIPRRTALVAGLIEHTLLPVKETNDEPKTSAIGR